MSESNGAGFADALRNKVCSIEEAACWRKSLERECKLVFTNGCFDILHRGHVDLLARARDLGGALVVAINSDGSVRGLKGASRPVNPCADRAACLAGLASVDRVVVFGEPTPLRAILALLPDVLVKGGDWPLEKIVGREVVEANGGRVLSLPLFEDRSTTRLIERIRGLENTT